MNLNLTMSYQPDYLNKFDIYLETSLASILYFAVSATEGSTRNQTG